MSSDLSNWFLRIRRRDWHAGVLALIILIQGVFGFVVGILLFYRGGIYFLDAGYYVYSLASENFGQQPPIIGDAWGSSLYATHMLLTPLLISQIFRVIASAPMNFIMFLGLQHLVLAFAGAMLMMVALWQSGMKKSNLLWPGIFAALLVPFSNIGLGSLLYPHVELIGSSLAAIGILLLVVRWSGHNSRLVLVGAATCLVLGLLAREDIGVHFLITVGSAVVCSQWKLMGRHGLRRAALLLLVGFSSAVILMAYQRIFAESHGVFALTYSGTPAYAHITSVWYIIGRILHLIGSRLDLIIGLGAFILGAAVLRRREFLAFPLAVAPWLILNLTAIDPAKNSMGIYHLFPIILYATAPILAISFGGGQTKRESDETLSAARMTVYATYGIAIVSLFLGGISSPPTGGGYLFTSVLRLPLISPAGITATNSAIEKFAAERSGIAVDDAVMAIRPVELELVPLIPTIQDAATINSIMFFPRYLLGHKGVLRLLNAWAIENRHIRMTCLPGGLVRADAGLKKDEATGQTDVGQLNKAILCHPFPK
jgi:hypothetical protein